MANPTTAETESAPRFTQGSTMRHVIVMTFSAAIGLMAIFLVDLLSIWYIQLIGDTAQTSAAGYASALLFFSISVSIGVMIGSSALVARYIGAKQNELSREYAFSGGVLMLVLSLLTTAIMMYFAHDLLILIGARAHTLELAYTYLMVTLAGTPALSMAISFSGNLRAKGEAKQSMYVTLSAGIFTAIADPILIFGFDLELLGAAIAVLLSRIITFCVGLYFSVFVHQQLKITIFSKILSQIKNITKIAGPAVLTNIASPFAATYILSQVSYFGDEVVAGWTYTDRMVPVAFGTIFALSGAVGPIMAQNHGAQLPNRVMQAFRDAHLFNLIYILIVWALFYLLQDQIISIFNATGDSARVIELFCTIAIAGFLFKGAIFVCNAAFNNLDHPLHSTAYNWLLATAGTIPFVYYGREIGGLEGVVIGLVLGQILLGILAICHSYLITKKVAYSYQNPDQIPNQNH